MKKLILAIVLGMFLIIPQANAAWLITVPMAGISTYDVEIDGNVIPAMNAEADGSLRYNVDSLASGAHTFRVKAIGTGGWPADYSPPFVAVKPETASGLIIVP